MIHPMDDKTGFEATDEELFGKTALCGDCPPEGYSTDKTHCLPYPRRVIPPRNDDYRKVEAMFNICATLILGSLTALFLIEVAGYLFEVFVMSVLT